MLLWQGGELYGNAGLSEVSGVLGSRNNTNVLELQAVLLALKQFLPVLVGKHVLVGTANTSVVYQVDHQGSTRSRQSSRLTQQLWLLAYPQCICQGNAFARHSKHGRGFVIPAAPTSWEMEAASKSGGSNLAEIGQGRGGSLRLTVDDALSPLVF